MIASCFHPFRAALRRGLVVSALGSAVFLSATTAWAQADGKDASRRRGAGEDDGAGRRAASPQDIQARMLSNLRERFGVTNDEEWSVISERLLKVFEIRRANGGGVASMMAQRGGPPGGGAGGQGAPGGGSAADRFRGARPGGGSPEAAALQAAVTDKLPEAEVKARLAQLRQTRNANEAKLEAAQDELRAVLTVRQEAQAVLMGLLN